MSNFREIVRRHVISETRQELPGDTEETKDKMLEFLINKGHIDQKTNEILEAFRAEIEKDSPRKKKENRNKVIYASLNIILTILIAYSVNSETWPAIWGLALISILVQVFFYIND